MDGLGFSWDFLLTATVTLFVVVDPLGVIPIFASLTAGTSFRHRISMAVRAVFIATVVMALFALFGEVLITRIGIGMPAFRTAGGILLFLIGLEMVFERRTRRRTIAAEKSLAEHELDSLYDQRPEDISVFPLALPLLAGPGAMASILLLMSENQGMLGAQATVLAGLVIVMMVTLVLLISAGPLLDYAGETASIVITRVMGMILAALSVQYVFDGLQSGLGLGAAPGT
ncbi:MAG: MarC family protein [Alphaproteobacteria bacterium]